MGTYKLLHEATTHEIRGGARQAVKTIEDLLADAGVRIDQVDIVRESRAVAAERVTITIEFARAKP